MIAIAVMYLLLIVGMIWADLWYAVTNVSKEEFTALFDNDDIRSSIKLTMISCTVTAILSIFVAVPIGYLMSRYSFPGKTLLDAVLDIPIVLPPLVVGLSLLILFNKVELFGVSIDAALVGLGESLEKICRTIGGWFSSKPVNINFDFGVTYKVPAVILAQFTVACAFAVRTMRNTFDQISPRSEQVALTLGCSRARAFFSVVLPEARRGISTAGTLAWTRAMGEFGPILVFASTIRGRTEVLSSTVFLEISIGNLEGAVIISLLMVSIAVVVLVAVRLWDRQNRRGVML